MISLKMADKFVPDGPIDNKLALFQIMAWHWTTIIWINDDPVQLRYMHHPA